MNSPAQTLLEQIVGAEPIVWTSKGNLPASSLTYKTRWEFDQGENGLLKTISFIEEHWLGEECVKQSVHVYNNQTAAARAEQGGF